MARERPRVKAEAQLQRRPQITEVPAPCTTMERPRTVAGVEWRWLEPVGRASCAAEKDREAERLTPSAAQETGESTTVNAE